MTRQDAKEYLRGLEPEAIGVAPVPAKSRNVRYDRVEIDHVLNGLSNISIDSSDTVKSASGGTTQTDQSPLDYLLGDND